MLTTRYIFYWRHQKTQIVHIVSGNMWYSSLLYGKSVKHTYISQYIMRGVHAVNKWCDSKTTDRYYNIIVFYIILCYIFVHILAVSKFNICILCIIYYNNTKTILWLLPVQRLPEGVTLALNSTNSATRYEELYLLIL